MQNQLRMKDVDGLTLAMHAVKSGNVAIAAVVTAEIEDVKVSTSW